ncbi:MAG: tripartite tricarboxylate transporter permease [Patescibacteria group bacterium]
MIEWSAFFQGLQLLVSWKTPVAIIIGMWIGLIFGVIPGLMGTMAIAVILPFTFLIDPLTSLILLTSIYTGSLTGSGITAILINTPGTPAGIATTFDGYPMTQKGQQNRALGLQITSSVFGGLFGYVFLLFFIRPMGRFALQFGSSEMLLIMVLVFLIIATIHGEHFFRTIFIGVFGLLLSTVGTSTTTGLIRGTMSMEALEDGFPKAIGIIGIFCIPELFDMIRTEYISQSQVTKEKHDLKKFFEGCRYTFRYVKTMVRSALIGTFIGILPAAGPTIASLFSYSRAKQHAKPSQCYGEGEPEGVVAAEVANNAAEGGSMSILIALGIPGSGTGALLIAAFMLQGLTVGPTTFRDHTALIYAIIVGNIFQMVFLGFFALLLAFYVSRVVFVPTRILAPALIVVITIGSFCFRNMFFDVYMVFLFGIIGWFFRRHHFSNTSFIIGFILGDGMDDEMYVFKALFGHDLTKIFVHPISIVLLVVILVTIGVQIYNYRQKSKERGFTINN